MTSSRRTIRVPGASREWLERIVAYDQSELDGGKTADLGSSAALGMARTLYALGEPWSVVAVWLRRAASSFVALLKYRDEGPEKRSLIGEYPTQKGIRTKEDLMALLAKKDTLPIVPDHSFTNSWTTLKYAWVALAARESKLARDVVEPMWDPDHAPYIGPKSKTCTLAQQRAAHAMRSLLLDDGNVGEHLSHVPPDMPEAALIRACLVEDRFGAVAAIERLRKRHEDSSPALHENAQDFLAVEALGAVGLVLSRGLVALEDLGQPTWYFPFRLAFADG